MPDPGAITIRPVLSLMREKFGAANRLHVRESAVQRTSIGASTDHLFLFGSRRDQSQSGMGRSSVSSSLVMDMYSWCAAFLGNHP